MMLGAHWATIKYTIIDSVLDACELCHTCNVCPSPWFPELYPRAAGALTSGVGCVDDASSDAFPLVVTTPPWEVLRWAYDKRLTPRRGGVQARFARRPIQASGHQPSGVGLAHPGPSRGLRLSLPVVAIHPGATRSRRPRMPRCAMDSYGHGSAHGGSGHLERTAFPGRLSPVAPWAHRARRVRVGRSASRPPRAAPAHFSSAEERCRLISAVAMVLSGRTRTRPRPAAPRRTPSRRPGFPPAIGGRSRA
jgi:hypothetical protein